jgi:DnaJ-domain-containing protein 1
VSQPATDDPFSVLGLPHTFRLDVARLRSAQVRILGGIHPDRATSSADAIDRSRLAARVNAAYRILGDPMERGRALLSVLGGSPTEKLSPAFLAESMELRESLDEAIADGDLSRVATVRSEAIQRRDEELERIAQAFDLAIEDPAVRLDALNSASEGIARLRYIARFIERCDTPRDTGES